MPVRAGGSEKTYYSEEEDETKDADESENRANSEKEDEFEGDNIICYSAEADYCLMQNILMPSGDTWMLPEGFTGSFTAAKESDDQTLYDMETDTIYLYHPYVEDSMEKVEPDGMLVKMTLQEKLLAGGLMVLVVFFIGGRVKTNKKRRRR